MEIILILIVSRYGAITLAIILHEYVSTSKDYESPTSYVHRTHFEFNFRQHLLTTWMWVVHHAPDISCWLAERIHNE